MKITFFVWFLFFSLTMHAQKEIKFLALGDSYTIGESVAESERWPNQLKDSLEKRHIHLTAPRIIATTGWRTDDLRHAMDKEHLKNEFGLVSLLIGVNNQYQSKSPKQYAQQFEELLRMAVALAGGQKENVFVISIPDYGYTPFGKPKQEAITKDIDLFNSINREITEKYGIDYVNITDISRRAVSEPSLVASDGLHPSGKMYALWVERIVEKRYPNH
jgi:lysophospholipase L1-like esterase